MRWAGHDFDPWIAKPVQVQRGFILGGMLSVLVTDFMQFVVMSAGLIVITLYILYHTGWTLLVNTASRVTSRLVPSG